jgi:hypothetical protein
MSDSFVRAHVAAPSFAAKRSIWTGRFRGVSMPTARRPSSCAALASIRQQQRTPTNGKFCGCFSITLVDPVQVFDPWWIRKNPETLFQELCFSTLIFRQNLKVLLTGAYFFNCLQVIAGRSSLANRFEWGYQAKVVWRRIP